ncbi:hypothetical protein GCM10027590_06540 [Nocardiopsis nanhaiensis]
MASPPPLPGEHSEEALAGWGTPSWRIASWLKSGAVADQESAAANLAPSPVTDRPAGSAQ